MLPRLAFACVTAIAMASSLGFAQAPSPNGVKTLNPPGAIKTEGTWSLGARAGDFVFVAGMQGVDPATNTLVQDPYARIERGRHAKHALCCCHSNASALALTHVATYLPMLFPAANSGKIKHRSAG